MRSTVTFHTVSKVWCIHPFLYFRCVCVCIVSMIIFTLDPKQAIYTCVVMLWLLLHHLMHIFVYNFCYIKHVTWNTQCHHKCASALHVDMVVSIQLYSYSYSLSVYMAKCSRTTRYACVCVCVASPSHAFESVALFNNNNNSDIIPWV